MPRTCTVCAHPEKNAINAALLAGEPYRTIAGHFGASASAVLRHKSDHLPASLTKAAEAKEIAQAGTLLDQVRDLQTKALHLLGQAEAAGDLRTALQAIKEARGCLELLMKATGELQPDTQSGPQVVVLPFVVREVPSLPVAPPPLLIDATPQERAA